MSRYKQTCNNCNTDYKSNGPYSKYCSKECRQESRAQERTYVGCAQCNTPIRFYPSQQNKFCSNQCQGKWVKENMGEERAERAAHMRKSLSDESWKKGLETRKKNGNVIENFDWKQYWKRCDWLTRKIRKQMLENWDGYDYIDGEYIKDNLKLHYSDKNYPTLDHIKPRSQCFKEGLSPYEATCFENLKWTKRINNSKKHSKFL
jgi:endogenous inhibitor of DNA gyrase (YacG/DUF329 family)